MQGPASLLDWKLQFANAADEEAFQRSQNLVSLGMDMSWSALITLAGTAAVRAGSGFPAFQARNIYINGCSSCLPVLLRLLCPVWYLENRRWLLTVIKIKHTILSPWRGLAFPRLDTWSSVVYSLMVSSRIWLQLGDCLFWSTGLHYEMLSSGFWLCMVGLIRAPLYCRGVPADDAFPVLRDINTFLSRLSSSVLAGLNAHAEPVALRQENVCPLTLAYLTVICGCILPLTSLLYFERCLRICYARRLLQARGAPATSGSLRDERLWSLITASGLALGLAVGMWQVVELLDALYPHGISG